ncbi:unnamed protein product [Meganyctiphanes norvegica]|uniref:Uncharacterized protein n=1 Tax=Meganyctiphanes norvegica TaxID=48144 RepID=A0AAV2R0Y3_MEGNR
MEILQLMARREERERRRERRRIRRERLVYRGPVRGEAPTVPITAELINMSPPPIITSHQETYLPDIIHSHAPDPPPYSTLPAPPPVGMRSPLGGMMPPPPPTRPPPSMPLHVSPTGAPLPAGQTLPSPGVPIGPGYPGPAPGSPLRPDGPWPIFGSRRSRSSPRGPPYLGEEEGKSCCGLMVTQAVSIRWFIIMIAFVGLCCTVVGTVIGAVKTYNSEYVTITLLMIGVGIVLIAVSGVAWHLTSRDAPCRVMLGMVPNDRSQSEPRRFMARMAPAFGRAHHPYSAMMYPEFPYHPPPPSYNASMQDYRLRLLMLDRQSNAPPAPSPPPTYRSGFRGLSGSTLGRESNHSHPPSYRSREGSIIHHPDLTPSSHQDGLALAHSRDPSFISYLSQDSVYSQGPPGPHSSSHPQVPAVFNGNKIPFPIDDSILSSSGTNSQNAVHRDDNTVTIVQTTSSSHVIGSDAVIVTVSGSDATRFATQSSQHSNTDVSVLAHL